MTYKRTLFPIILSLVFSFSFVFADTCPIVPLPSQFAEAGGHLNVSTLERIRVADRQLFPIAHFLQKEVLKHTGFALSLSAAPGDHQSIIIEFAQGAPMADEGYKLSVYPDHAVISASTPHGAFNGVVSLLQLIRLAAAEKGEPVIACWRISDSPQMAWRGLMLDESRHFFGMETVKRMLDWMAFYKLNRFHWHLTDVPGWRFEVKAFPDLALVGGIGNHTDSLAPAKYYTQEEINEIVRYARERFIEIIPEIDMPGHARAANRAYPGFSGGGSKSYPEFTFNPGKEGTYEYLAKILREVDVLFPSKMIHVGGDEVDFGNENWKTDADVQALMKRNRLAGLKAVEHYFTERMADTVIHLGAKVLGWDEIAATKIPAGDMIIFWWRQNKPEALKTAIDNGYKVVLCPRIPLYFDFVQDSAHRVGRKWAGAFSDLKSIFEYSMDRYPDIITKNNRGQVMGIQANIWTERIVSEARLEYMLFPRIAALAEAAWTRTEKRDYDIFLKARLPGQQTLFRRSGLHYYDVGNPSLTPEIID
ncbi:MAG TPA: beta-N-acetylhexosaminidase [Chryseosolibacter sp.]